MQMTFQDQVVFITGAASGLGRDMAIRFAAQGAKVVIADVQEAAALETVAAIHAQNCQAMAITCDVSDEASVNAAIAKTMETYGALHIAINNAGIGGARKPVAQYELDDWNKVIAINQTGVFLCLRAQLQAMLPLKQGGVIINVASVAGLKGLPLAPAYTASKHAVVGLTKAAALEYARYNIRINAVCPVFTQTPLLDELFSADASLVEKLEKNIPLRRYGVPADITNAVLWLADPASTYVTGLCLPIDGGMMA
jgi:NAD(P)-dependent dehydrogenase (short-subunit alcohol dehydrogenase family)